jgi:hypothetical protein
VQLDGCEFWQVTQGGSQEMQIDMFDEELNVDTFPKGHWMMHSPLLKM